MCSDEERSVCFVDVLSLESVFLSCKGFGIFAISTAFVTIFNLETDFAKVKEKEKKKVRKQTIGVERITQLFVIENQKRTVTIKRGDCQHRTIFGPCEISNRSVVNVKRESQCVKVLCIVDLNTV
jgi:hypothetical protein